MQAAQYTHLSALVFALAHRSIGPWIAACCKQRLGIANRLWDRLEAGNVPLLCFYSMYQRLRIRGCRSAEGELQVRGLAREQREARTRKRESGITTFSSRGSAPHPPVRP